ncbi:MAG: hypothetical protein ACXW1Y_09940, partial [Acidimicrobiia bacterium]
PPSAFKNPTGVETDAYGTIYVANAPGANEGKIDIFNPSGDFLTEIQAQYALGSIAVDSAGRLYAAAVNYELGIMAVLRYTPSSFPPTSSTDYGLPDSVGRSSNNIVAVAVDHANDQLYVDEGTRVSVYDPDGALDGLDEVQRLAVDASGGTFGLVVFSNGGRGAGTATLTAGSPTADSLVVAAGTGNLTSGSTAVTSVTTTSGAFKAGQPISGSGIAGGTTIAEVTRGPASGFIRLSKAATATGTNTSITSDGPKPFDGALGQRIVGPGIPPGTTIETAERGSLTLSANATESGGEVPFTVGEKGTAVETGGMGTASLTAGSPVATSLASATGTGTLRSGSARIEPVTTTTGAFHTGQTITGPGIQPGTKVTFAVSGFLLAISKPASASGTEVALTAQDPFAPGQAVSGQGIPAGTTIESVGVGTLTMSADATESSTASLRAAILYNAPAQTVQASLEALWPIGEGNVSVTGGPGASNPYLISFIGALGNQDVSQIGAEGGGLENGTARLTTSTPGYDGRIGVEPGSGSLLYESSGLTIDGWNHDVYAASHDSPVGTEWRPWVVRVFDGSDGHLKRVIDGSAAPLGGFQPSLGISPALDEQSGHLFVSNIAGSEAVYEFDAEDEYVSTITHSFEYVQPSEIAIDNSATSPNRGYLYVTSMRSAVGHLYAFKPKPDLKSPSVSGEKSLGIGSREARLEALVNPNGAASRYRFEYVDDATLQRDVSESGPDHGFEHALKLPQPDALLAAGNQSVRVAQPVYGLKPATKYHFRIVARNECEEGKECVTEGEQEGEDEVERVFATYPESALGLPDGRAYELVTPPGTSGRAPTAGAIGIGDGFDASLAAPGGDRVAFETQGGSLPGLGGAGGFDGDGYLAVRGSVGWETQGAGPSGVESQAPRPGSPSPDLGYWFWKTFGKGDEGTLAIGDLPAHYVRKPDGSFDLVGVGSLGFDPTATGRLITAGAGHIIFQTGVGDSIDPIQLEPNAPPTGVGAIYDRSDGVTHVVSLLPGDETPDAQADYLGAAADGTAIAFKIGMVGEPGEPDTRPLYVRVRNMKTLEVSQGANTDFAGLSSNGRYLFYLEGRNIFRFDTETAETSAVTLTGDATPVNISADGSHVYFVSQSQIGGEGSGGGENLYVWDGGTNFIATLTSADVVGREEASGDHVAGLGLWVEGLGAAGHPVDINRGPAIDPSRTTPDGGVLVFESRANLAGYASEGKSEIYRYDAGSEALSCLSCSPTLSPAVSDATLEQLNQESAFIPTNALSHVVNVTSDGSQVFFQTKDALVPGDVNGTQDVYEWEASGHGSCRTNGGCLSLVSSGHSANDSYLYAMTPDGHDVFFTTTDRLVPRDTDSTSSIYDARIGGGFPEAEQESCEGEACQAQASPSPLLPSAASETFTDAGNVKHRHRHRHRRHHRASHQHRKAHHKHGARG